uniref:Protein kinase domain-containing protein n=1 Tax=Meloidogyne incognita TaxID=6306 RepID=A0A914MY58_MELIC
MSGKIETRELSKSPYPHQLVISNNDITSESPLRVASSPGTLSAAELTGNGHLKNELIIDQRPSSRVQSPQQKQRSNSKSGFNGGAKRSGSTCSTSSTISSVTGLPLLPHRFFTSSTLPALPTPLDSQFHCLQATGQILSGHWHHFTAQATVGTDKDASVLLFDKKCNVKGPSRLGRANRLGLSDLLRYDLSQLQQLVHPRILRLLHPLVENKELIGFASEPLYCTLDKLLLEREDEQHFNINSQSEKDSKQLLLDKLEMKLGVLQLVEGLSYLHNNAKILHGNLTPQAVFVTSFQHWKIGGFAFSVAPKKPGIFPCFPWTKKLPACLQPDLDFLAPEYLIQNAQTVTLAADVFSLGVLICWIYSNGKRLIDVKNNLESYQIVIEQLDIGLQLIANELGPNLKASLVKVLSKEVEQRPAIQMLALIKHFDEPSLGALRQLDDLAQEFDPANKAAFLRHSLSAILPQIPESLWFRRVLRRFNEHLQGTTELMPALISPLCYMLKNCESHNIHRLRPWFRQIAAAAEEKSLSQSLLSHMPIILRRLSDEQVEDRCLDLLIYFLNGTDPHLKQNSVRALPHIVEFIPNNYLSKRLIPTLQNQAQFFQEQVSRQIDLLVAIGHLSDRCDTQTLQYLLTLSSVCSTLHPAIVHSKSRLVQRILTCDVSRFSDPLVIAHHLLNPLVLGLALPEISPAHFDDVMSSSRILLDIIEQLRYDSDDTQLKENNYRRLCNRRVSMSSNHLPRLLITAATRPSIGGDSRKMSFLSADGRLEEDRGGGIGSVAGALTERRESKDSRCSLESEVSLRICNGSDLSDESVLPTGPTFGGIGNTGVVNQVRRKSWIERGCLHSLSLEQPSRPSFPPSSTTHLPPLLFGGGRARSSVGSRTTQSAREHSPFSALVRRLPSPKEQRQQNSRQSNTEDNHLISPKPNSFSNLGHNLACTLWKTFH